MAARQRAPARVRSCSPRRAAFSCSPSSRIASSTASPDHARHRAAAGRRRRSSPGRAKASAISRVVITAPSGWPLPVALATVDDVGHDALLLECPRTSGRAGRSPPAPRRRSRDRRRPARARTPREVAVGQRACRRRCREAVRQMNAAAGGRPSADRATSRRPRARSAAASGRRGGGRGRGSAWRRRAPRRAGGRGAAGCRPTEVLTASVASSSRGTPRAPRSRRAAGDGPRQAQGQIDGLGAGVDEEHGVERRRQRRRAARRTRPPLS